MLGSWRLKAVPEGWPSNQKLKVIHSLVPMRNAHGMGAGTRQGTRFYKIGIALHLEEEVRAARYTEGRAGIVSPKEGEAKVGKDRPSQEMESPRRQAQAQASSQAAFPSTHPARWQGLDMVQIPELLWGEQGAPYKGWAVQSLPLNLRDE